MGEASSVYTAVGSLALVLIPICVYTARQLWSLLPLLENRNEIRLEFDNGQLQGTRFWILFLSLIIKSVLRRTGLISLPRFVEGPNGRYTLQGYSDISLNMPFKFTKEDISLYTLSVGKSVHLDENLLHLQLFLSAMTEPAMLILLSKRGCPIDPIGSVNVRNSFQLLDRPAAVSLITNHGSLNGYRIKSTLPMDTQKVKRGWEYRFVVDLINDESRPIFRQTFTMLQFARHGTFPDLLIESEKEIRTDTIGRIEIPPESPATWAKLCKDYNPIHLSSIAARALGFKSTIAHGNHVVARALALSPRSDKEVGWMEVEFKRPVLLPATLDVASSEESGRMEIGQKEKVHVLVRYGDSSCSEP